MDTASMSRNPNSRNPNCAPQLSNELNDSPYIHILNYLMSDFDDHGSDNNLLLNDKDASPDNCSHGSSNSLSNMKPRRGLKECDTHEEFRFAFRTKTGLEFMDDGYKWRKYGKKMVKDNPYPRNYFKCSNGGCKVKKRVERESGDPSYVITTYQGIHNHYSPTYTSSNPPHSLVSLTPSSIP